MAVTVIRREGLVRAPVSLLYAIVADVERYPEFLSEVKSVTRDGDRVTMAVEFGTLRISWEQRVTFVPNRALQVRLTHGPFKVFDVDWNFEPVAEGTRLTHETRFELSFRLPGVGLVVKRGLERHTEHTIEAFRKRLESLCQTGELPTHPLRFSEESGSGR